MELLTDEEIKQAKATYGNRKMDAGYTPEHFDVHSFDRVIIQAQLAQDQKSEQELIELLKKVDIRSKKKQLFWISAAWLVSSQCGSIYHGDSLIEALKILTKEK